MWTRIPAGRGRIYSLVCSHLTCTLWLMVCSLNLHAAPWVSPGHTFYARMQVSNRPGDELHAPSSTAGGNQRRLAGVVRLALCISARPVACQHTTEHRVRLRIRTAWAYMSVRHTIAYCHQCRERLHLPAASLVHYALYFDNPHRQVLWQHVLERANHGWVKTLANPPLQPLPRYLIRILFVAGGIHVVNIFLLKTAKAMRY